MWIEARIYRTLLLAASIAPAAVAEQGGLQVLQDLVAGRRCADYRPATAGELQQAQSAFAALLAKPGAVSRTATERWAQLGFSLTTVNAAGVTWTVVHEPPGRCRGQGLYLVRQGAAASLLLQIPHGYADRDTDDIAAGLLQTPLRAMAFNTVPRHFTRHGKRVDSDFAHRADNLFAPLTRAFARAYPAGRVVQLHGFDPAKRDTAAGRSAAVIVSAGSARATPASTAVAACLQAWLQDPVRLYPRDVRELGATTNLQGAQLRELAHNGFVHVELSRVLREQLRKAALSRTGFAACLYAGMEDQ